MSNEIMQIKIYLSDSLWTFLDDKDIEDLRNRIEKSFREALKDVSTLHDDIIMDVE